MTITCPICEKDDAIQKLSVIVKSGQSSGSFSGSTGGVSYADEKWGSVGGYNVLYGQTTTELAKILTPPLEPKDKAFSPLVSGFIWYFLGIGIVLNVFLMILFFSSAETAGGGLGSVVFIIASFFMLRWWYLKTKSVRENYPIQKTAWNAAMETWNRLYFCHRDGIVFDPETQKTCQPDSVREFIYS